MAEQSPTTGSNGNGLGLSVPAPNFEEQGKAQAIGGMAAGWIDDLIRKHVLSHASGGGGILGAIASLVDDYLAVIVAFFDQVQGKGTPGFFTLMAELLGGLLGIEISADHINTAWKRGGTHAGFAAVGASYWAGMMTQLGSPKTLTPESGLAAAQGFLGYLLGFSIREGNLGFITSLIPEEWRITDGIEEYARAMRSSLGLGRMARQALHPLIQTLITDPLQWYVNRTYMPKLLGTSQAIRAYNRNLITQDMLNQEATYDGYNSQRLEAMIEEVLEQLGNSELYTLLKWGYIDRQEFTILMKRRGVHPVDADRYLQYARFNEADSAVNQTLSVLRGQFVNGFIDGPTFENMVNTLPLGDEQKVRFIAAVHQETSYPRTHLAWGNVQDAVSRGLLTPADASAWLTGAGYGDRDAAVMIGLPRKTLTLSQVQEAFLEGLIDSTDIANYLRIEGYSDDDAQTLWYLTLLKLGTKQAKQAVAQYAYNKAKAAAEKKGEPPPPPPAILAEQPIENPLPSGL